MSNAQTRLTQLERELENARAVQAAFIPSSKTLSNLDFAVQCVPADAIGGDICDVFEADHGRTAVVMGDVSGKGMPAALLAGMLSGAIHASSWTESSFDHAEATERLNDLMRRKTSADRFASLFWGYYEPETSTFRYINAGHLPMLLIRRVADGSLKVERLEEGGPILGIVDWGHYQQGSVRIQEGDLLIAYSDGIVEAMNESKDLFGEDRLLEVIRTCRETSSTGLRDAIVSAVTAHIGEDTSGRDDQTLIVGEFRTVFNQMPDIPMHELAFESGH
jgi:sigma-B regulation protein RsbU (phosphoserine phosphatase)